MQNLTSAQENLHDVCHVSGLLCSLNKGLEDSNPETISLALRSLYNLSLYRANKIQLYQEKELVSNLFRLVADKNETYAMGTLYRISQDSVARHEFPTQFPEFVSTILTAKAISDERISRWALLTQLNVWSSLDYVSMDELHPHEEDVHKVVSMLQTTVSDDQSSRWGMDDALQTLKFIATMQPAYPSFPTTELIELTIQAMDRSLKHETRDKWSLGLSLSLAVQLTFIATKEMEIYGEKFLELTDILFSIQGVRWPAGVVRAARALQFRLDEEIRKITTRDKNSALGMMNPPSSSKNLVFISYHLDHRPAALG